MKKNFFFLISILLILIIGVLLFVKINNDRNKEEEVISEEVTSVPTQTPGPTEAPEPTIREAPKKVTQLYPAYQIFEDIIKHGYIDASGQFVIEPEFDMASDFHEGRAVVYINNQYCMINENGEVLYISDGALEDFHNGYAVISRYANEVTQYGYIDRTGKEVIEPQYEMAYAFSEEGKAYVYQGDGKYSIIDGTGTILESYTVDPKYSYWRLNDGYIIYQDEATEKQGVINLKGEVIYEPIYSEINYVGKDLFAMKEPSLAYYDQIMNAPAALFNSEGRQLTDYIFYDLTVFHDGYASVTDDTTTYFIKPDGSKASELPTMEGRGSLTLFGDVIKAELDYDLFYSLKNGTNIWKVDQNTYLSNDLTVKSEKFKANKYILVHYPQLEGLKDAAVQEAINEQLRSLFADSRSIITEEDQNLTVDDNFRAELMNNLLIIERTGYDYYFGAAHGMPIMDYYYIDIRTGTFYNFKDLFIEGSEYAVKINELINIDIAAQVETGESMIFEGSFQGITETPNYHITEDALIIYFYPYDIAAYAAGFPEFTIPFVDLMDYINKDSDFWKAFH